MPMSAAYLNAIANHGAGLVTHVGLVNALGVELSGGGYARLPASWVGAGAEKSLSANRLFSVAAGAQVAGWRGYSALTGGADFGGADLVQRNYTNPGTYELLAADTKINHVTP